MSITTFTNRLIAPFLFRKGNRPNTIARLAGAFSGGQIRVVSTPQFSLGASWNAPTAELGGLAESAPAKAAMSLNITQETSAVMSFSETVATTDLAAATPGRTATTFTVPGAGNGQLLVDPNTLEGRKLIAVEKIQSDFNFSAINSTFNLAANANQAYRMRGLNEAIVSNVNTAVDPRVLTMDLIEDAMVQAIGEGTFEIGGTFVIAGRSNLIAKLNDLAVTAGVAPASRDVVGFGPLREIYTKWGTILPVVEPDVPADTLFLINPARVGVVAVAHPVNGVLYEIELAKTGAQESVQIFAPGMALDYGSESYHAVIRNVTAA
jgi:hypothetical protein